MYCCVDILQSNDGDGGSEIGSNNDDDGNDDDDGNEIVVNIDDIDVGVKDDIDDGIDDDINSNTSTTNNIIMIFYIFLYYP